MTTPPAKPTLINCCGCRTVMPEGDMVQMPHASLWICRECVQALNSKWAQKARRQKWAFSR